MNKIIAKSNQKARKISRQEVTVASNTRPDFEFPSWTAQT